MHLYNQNHSLFSFFGFIFVRSTFLNYIASEILFYHCSYFKHAISCAQDFRAHCCSCRLVRRWWRQLPVMAVLYISVPASVISAWLIFPTWDLTALLAGFVESALNSGCLLMSNQHHHRYHPVMATRLRVATSQFSINLWTKTGEATALISAHDCSISRQVAHAVCYLSLCVGLSLCRC